MSRNQAVPDCFSVLTNNKRMTRSEIAGFQSDFNVNLNDEDDWFDVEFSEGLDLTEISDEEFLAQCMGDDLSDSDYTDYSMRQGEMGR